MDDVVKRGTAREMIAVMANATNAYFGSFYTNSSVTGRWEDVIVEEVVPWIDGNYRTIPNPETGSANVSKDASSVSFQRHCAPSDR